MATPREPDSQMAEVFLLIGMLVILGAIIYSAAVK